MRERKRKITITYDNGLEVKEIKMESLYIDGPSAEDIASAARLLLVLVSYPPEIAQSLVFVDREERERLGIDDGTFYGSL